MAPEDESRDMLDLIEQDARWEKYHQAAQGKTSKILAMTAITVDDIRKEQVKQARRLEDHCRTSVDRAHPPSCEDGTDCGEPERPRRKVRKNARPRTKAQDDELEVKGNITMKTIIKIILIIAAIATGGAAISYLMPLIGG
jgi:hypothetical protein